MRRACVVLVSAGLALPLWSTGVAAAGAESQQAVTTSSYTFVDTTRSTPCSGAPDRTLKVTVATPGVSRPSPVALVGPGSGASQRAVARADAVALAGRGYVGVALDFPCTNAPGYSTIDPTVALDIYNQPADVSFVLTELLSLSASPGNELSGLLDAARVGMVGTSSGAITGLLFFNTCCTDTRIRALQLVKGFPPPTTAGFPMTGVYDWSRPIATYFWNGCVDLVIAYDSAASAYSQLGAPKAFVTDPTGGHDTPPVFPDATAAAFLDRYLAGDLSPLTAAPFLAADDDPYFGYDLGGSVPAHLATAGCASSEPAPPATTVPLRTPAFTG